MKDSWKRIKGLEWGVRMVEWRRPTCIAEKRSGQERQERMLIQISWGRMGPPLSSGAAVFLWVFLWGRMGPQPSSAIMRTHFWIGRAGLASGLVSCLLAFSNVTFSRFHKTEKIVKFIIHFGISHTYLKVTKFSLGLSLYPVPSCLS